MAKTARQAHLAHVAHATKVKAEELQRQTKEEELLRTNRMPAGVVSPSRTTNTVGVDASPNRKKEDAAETKRFVARQKQAADATAASRKAYTDYWEAMPPKPRKKSK